MTCVLQVPRTSVKGGLNGDHEPNGANGVKSGSTTDTIAFAPKRKNGAVQKGKRNGSSSSTKKLEDANYMDVPVPAHFVAETNLPTDVGQFRLRAYRTAQSANEFAGNEPCVIYSADKPPFGSSGEFLEDVPVRIHDQCLTSEVFRSQR